MRSVQGNVGALCSPGPCPNKERQHRKSIKVLPRNFTQIYDGQSVMIPSCIIISNLEIIVSFLTKEPHT